VLERLDLWLDEQLEDTPFMSGCRCGMRP
jgi:hypothetical protein